MINNLLTPGFLRGTLKSQALAEIVTNMDANKRFGLLKRLLEERQEILLPAQTK